MSNYDGDLEDYKNGDFINKAALGLNIYHLYGMDHPKTCWLVQGGAR